MLVTFIGAPIAGKTTTAATLFANLKEQGLPVEFLTEYARMYIAQKRRLEGGSFSGLDDLDQYAIFEEQAKHEEIFSADPQSIVIADSSAVSSLLYMSPAFIEQERNREPPFGHPNAINRARLCAERYDIVFRCSPVRSGVLYDPNRIHSYEQSLELDKRINDVFDLVKMSGSKVYPLFGDTKFRVTEAAAVVMRKVVDNLKRAGK